MLKKLITQKIGGSIDILDPKKKLGPKEFKVQNVLGPRKILSEIFLFQKILCPQKLPAY